MRRLSHSYEELSQLFRKQLQHQDGVELSYVKKVTDNCYGVLEQGLNQYMYFHVQDGIVVMNYFNDMISAEYNILSIHENSLHKVTPYEITLCRMKLNELEEILRNKTDRYSKLENEQTKQRLQPTIEQLELEVFKWRYILKQAKQDLSKTRPTVQENKKIVQQR